MLLPDVVLLPLLVELGGELFEFDDVKVLRAA